MFKSGFVSLIGRPNVGKSTLMNSFLKHKVAIMSNKAQTTRNRIQGIYTDERAQVIFIDTPGIHKPRSSLSNFMNKTAYGATRDVELILFLIDRNTIYKFRIIEIRIIYVIGSTSRVNGKVISALL